MIRKLTLLALTFCFCGFIYAAPLDRLPLIKKTVDVVTPEEYSVTITLTGGETIQTKRIALTPRSLEKRFTLNAVDKTVRVMPEGESERRVIPTHTIEKIEVIKVREEPKPAPVE